MVEVVNMRTCDPPWGQEGDVRIDRATKWGNPHHITNTNTRNDVLIEYAWYLANALANKDLDISELSTAKRLGCWRKPKVCHGDTLKKAIEQFNDSKQKRLV